MFVPVAFYPDLPGLSRINSPLWGKNDEDRSKNRPLVLEVWIGSRLFVVFLIGNWWDGKRRIKARA
jgi:hypothetical protein